MCVHVCVTVISGSILYRVELIRVKQLMRSCLYRNRPAAWSGVVDPVKVVKLHICMY